MRWLVLLVLSIVPLANGAEINDINAIQSRIVDIDSFKFFYIGHAYGAHKGKGYWAKYDTAYPHPELLKNIDRLAKYDFGVFGGDIVEHCNKKNLEVLENILLKPLGVPILNSTGNHDHCMEKYYGYSDLVRLNIGENVFLAISSREKTLGTLQADWLANQIIEFAKSDIVRRLFIFTHRPMFFSLDSRLSQAAKLSNYPVIEDHNRTTRLKEILFEKLDPKKEVFWFAGDLGMQIPIVYLEPFPNVHFVASGLFERPMDNILTISVNEKDVRIDVVGLSENIDTDVRYYDPAWLANYLVGTKKPSSRLSERMISRLLDSLGISNDKRILPVSIEGDQVAVFEFFHSLKPDALLLRRKKCEDGGENQFFVQFYPSSVGDREVSSRSWNGYHFYARRAGGTGDDCIAAISIPEYPIQFINVGQLDEERKVVWQARLNVHGE